VSIALHPARIWSAGDGVRVGLSVLVDGNRIAKIAPRGEIGAADETIELPGCTLLPGLMDLHSHLFLHPYNETPWDDQVLKQSEAYRTVRAVNHARDTLAAEAMQLIAGVTVLFVVEDERPVGILSMHDLLRAGVM